MSTTQTAVAQCSGEVKGDGRHGWLHPSRCTKRGAFEHEGKMYCKQHHPRLLAEYNEARNKRWQEKWDLEKAEAAKKAAIAAAERAVIAAAEAWRDISHVPVLSETLLNLEGAVDALREARK